MIITTLTFPISCGPGSIAAAIIVGVSLHDVDIRLSLAGMGGALLVFFSVSVPHYLAFRYA